MKTEPNQALEPTTIAVTLRAPSRTKRASYGRGSSLTLGKNFDEQTNTNTKNKSESLV